jgi:hypothetical protein
MFAPLRFIPHTNVAGTAIALDQPQWVGIIGTSANAQGSRKIRPYVYDVTLPTGERAYYLLTSAEKRNFTRTHQGAVCQKLKLNDIARISEGILPIARTALNNGQRSQLCTALLNMARKFEAKDSSGFSAAARKISNDFSNLFKTIKIPLPRTSSKYARDVIGAYPSAIGAVAPPAPTTLDKINIFITNLIKSPNFWRGMKILTVAAAVALIVVTGRLEMIAVLCATIILQQLITKNLMNG